MNGFKTTTERQHAASLLEARTGAERLQKAILAINSHLAPLQDALPDTDLTSFALCGIEAMAVELVYIVDEAHATFQQHTGSTPPKHRTAAAVPPRPAASPATNRPTQLTLPMLQAVGME